MKLFMVSEVRILQVEAVSEMLDYSSILTRLIT
jgi:hypothetical protein